MGNLERLMYYFIKSFPQSLGRTMLIKAIYLLDCEWYKSFGETYSGLEYERDYKGPFDTEFYQAKDYLVNENVISEMRHPGGYGYQYSITQDSTSIYEELNPIVRSIADEIVDRLSYKDLNSFLDLAYNTEPMLEVLQEEERQNAKSYGRVLDMSKNKKTLSPLFDFNEIRDVARKLDQSERGSNEDYNRTIIEEMNDLSVYRERVEAVCHQVDKE